MSLLSVVHPTNRPTRAHNNRSKFIDDVDDVQSTLCPDQVRRVQNVNCYTGTDLDKVEVKAVTIAKTRWDSLDFFWNH